MNLCRYDTSRSELYNGTFLIVLIATPWEVPTSLRKTRHGNKTYGSETYFQLFDREHVFRLWIPSFAVGLRACLLRT